MNFAPAKIYDLQIYAVRTASPALCRQGCADELRSAVQLMALFLQGTTAPQSTWPVIGAGIRMALDVGAHRKKMYSPTPTVEEELWKRAYWYLVGFDRTGSAAMGRTCSTRPEDADAELPLAVDDEFWETDDPRTAFRQPEDRPARQVAPFILWLRLTEITAFVLMHLVRPFSSVVERPRARAY